MNEDFSEPINDIHDEVRRLATQIADELEQWVAEQLIQGLKKVGVAVYIQENKIKDTGDKIFKLTIDNGEKGRYEAKLPLKCSLPLR